jgi:hypothetical protein
MTIHHSLRYRRYVAACYLGNRACAWLMRRGVDTVRL